MPTTTSTPESPLAETLLEYERTYAEFAAGWPDRLEAIKRFRLDLIAAHAALAEYGRDRLEHAVNDADRAIAKQIFTAAERMADVRPKQLDVIQPPTSPRDQAIAIATWKQRFVQSLKAKV
jgi:hypothetical protein